MTYFPRRACIIFCHQESTYGLGLYLRFLALCGLWASVSAIVVPAMMFLGVPDPRNSFPLAPSHLTLVSTEVWLTHLPLPPLQKPWSFQLFPLDFSHLLLTPHISDPLVGEGGVLRILSYSF
jgi:hypothetical protein